MSCPMGESSGNLLDNICPFLDGGAGNVLTNSIDCSAALKGICVNMRPREQSGFPVCQGSKEEHAITGQATQLMFADTINTKPTRFQPTVVQMQLAKATSTQAAAPSAPEEETAVQWRPILEQCPPIFDLVPLQRDTVHLISPAFTCREKHQSAASRGIVNIATSGSVGVNAQRAAEALATVITHRKKTEAALTALVSENHFARIDDKQVPKEREGRIETLGANDAYDETFRRATKRNEHIVRGATIQEHGYGCQIRRSGTRVNSYGHSPKENRNEHLKIPRSIVCNPKGFVTECKTLVARLPIAMLVGIFSLVFSTKFGAATDLQASQRALPTTSNCTTTSLAVAGQLELQVNSIACFHVGDKVSIGGTERHAIVGVGSVILDSPLQDDWPEGTTITTVQPSPVPRLAVETAVTSSIEADVINEGTAVTSIVEGVGLIEGEGFDSSGADAKASSKIPSITELEDLLNLAVSGLRYKQAKVLVKKLNDTVRETPSQPWSDAEVHILRQDIQGLIELLNQRTTSGQSEDFLMSSDSSMSNSAEL